MSYHRGMCSAWPTRTTLLVVAIGLATAIVLGACGGGGSVSSSPSTAPSDTATPAKRAKKQPPTPTPTARPLDAALLVRDLVAVPDDPGFEVDFAWKKGVPTGHVGLFVWRQGNSDRRFDFSAAGAKNARSGWFSFEPGVHKETAGVEAPGSTFCFWFGEQAASMPVTCPAAPPSRALSSTIYAALSAPATGAFDDRMIAGRNAKCYSYDDGASARGALCVDAVTKAPLYLTGTPPSHQLDQEIEATTIVAPAGALLLPAGLPGDVAVPDAPKLQLASLMFPAVMKWDK